MSSRARAVVLVALCISILAAALAVEFWPEDVRTPAPSEPSPAPAAIVTPPPIASQEVDDAGSPPVVELDAGARAPGAITIALVRDGKPVSGPRVRLGNARGEMASRPTDVMGLATFELPPGQYLVWEPRELGRPSLEVTSSPRQVTLTLPPNRRVSGQVLDAQGAPLAEIEVSDDGAETLARTDEQGRFSFTTTEESLVLVAESGLDRASKRISPPVADVLLRLEPSAWLTVEAPLVARVNVDVTSRSSAVTKDLYGRGQVRVPLEELEVRALAVKAGQLLRARHQVVPRGDRFDSLVLDFRPAPPITGVVRGPDGQPARGVTVGLKLAPARSSEPPRVQETTVTDERGQFQLVPRLIRGGDPVYEVHVLAPWRERERVLVRLGDAALVVDAEPAP